MVGMATATAYDVRGYVLMSSSFESDTDMEWLVVSAKTVQIESHGIESHGNPRRMIAYWRVRYTGAAVDTIVVTRWGGRTRTGRDPITMMTGREQMMRPDSPLRPLVARVTRDGRIDPPYPCRGHRPTSPIENGTQWVAPGTVEMFSEWGMVLGKRVRLEMDSPSRVFRILL